jgi:hypothetical protein
MMKLLRSPRTRTTLRRRTHAFARTAEVRVHPDLHGALAIAIGSRTGVVAQIALRRCPAMQTHAQRSACLASAAPAVALPKNRAHRSQNTSRPKVRSEVVFNRRDAIATTTAVWS